MEPDLLQAVVTAGIFILIEVVVTPLMIVVNRRAAAGRLGRNQTTGIRTPSTMRSDQAWLAGHRAALRLTPLWIANAIVACAALLYAALRPWSIGAITILGVGCVAMVVAIALYTALVAGRAARAVADDDDRGTR